MRNLKKEKILCETDRFTCFIKSNSVSLENISFPESFVMMIDVSACPVCYWAPGDDRDGVLESDRLDIELSWSLTSLRVQDAGVRTCSSQGRHRLSETRLSSSQEHSEPLTRVQLTAPSSGQSEAKWSWRGQGGGPWRCWHWRRSQWWGGALAGLGQCHHISNWYITDRKKFAYFLLFLVLSESLKHELRYQGWITNRTS